MKVKKMLVSALVVLMLLGISFPTLVQDITLTVFGDTPFLNTEALNQDFLKNNPTITNINSEVNNLGQLYSETSLQQAILTGDTTIDVYSLYVPGLYNEMLKKEYLVPITNLELVEKAGQFAPVIQNAIFYENNLMVYPIGINIHNWVVNQTKWEEYNLGTYPSTYGELLDLMDLWISEYSLDYPAEKLFELNDGFEEFIHMTIKEYILQNEYKVGDFTFNTTEFRVVMKDIITRRYIIDDYTALDGNESLIYTYNVDSGVGLYYLDGNIMQMIAPPAFTKEDDQKVAVTLIVVGINPTSIYIQEAEEYIKTMAQYLPTQSRYLLTPSLMKPVKNPNSPKRIAEVKEKIATLEKKLEIEDNREKGKIQEELELEKQLLTNLENYQWEISVEGIELYRDDILPKLYIPLNTSFLAHEDYTGSYGSLTSVIDTYLKKGLTIDQLDSMISDMDKVVQINLLEDSN